jgi:hypothetical protein
VCVTASDLDSRLSKSYGHSSTARYDRGHAIQSRLTIDDFDFFEFHLAGLNRLKKFRLGCLGASHHVNDDEVIHKDLIQFDDIGVPERVEKSPIRFNNRHSVFHRISSVISPTQ